MQPIQAQAELVGGGYDDFGEKRRAVSFKQLVKSTADTIVTDQMELVV
jgi:hypothetical protein